MWGFIAYHMINRFAIDCSAKPTFFGLDPWYKYLNIQPVKDASGTVVGCQPADSFTVLGAHSSLLLIGLAILDDLIRLAALVAVGFVIYGGITYVTSQGSPDQTGKAQSTIVNALIGLVVALVAVGLVNFIAGTLAPGAIG